MTLTHIFTRKFGLHPPDRLSRTSPMTPQRLKLIVILVMTGVFRFFLIVASNLYSIPAYLLLMTVLRPLRHLSEETYWYIEGVLFRKLQLLVATWMWSAGYTVQECGDDIEDLEDEQSIVMANHQSTADVPSLMYALQFHGRVLDELLWIMDVMFRNTNFGFVSRMHEDFFIQQGKETRHLQPVLLRKHLLDTYIPRKRKWIVLFPEGGFLWRGKKMSLEYGKKNGFPLLEHCLLPRSGAVQTMLETLNLEAKDRPIKWLVDITIAYPTARPLNFQTIIVGQRDPMVTTLHYRKYPISQVPTEADALRDWIFERYNEKDQLLEAFYKTGKFPVPPEGVRDELHRLEPKKLDLNITDVVIMHLGFILLTCLECYCISSIVQMIFMALSSMF